LAKKVFDAIKIDGLVWGKEYKKVPVVHDIKALRLSMVIEDDKVLTDDVFDTITAWEDEVQSVDVVTMQKVWGS